MRSSAIGNGGSISIDTNSLSLENNGKISTTGFGTGNAGDININSENISIAFGSIESFSRDGAIGNPGNIAIVNAGKVSLASFPNNAFAGIQNQVFGNAEGDVGTISIDTGSLTLSDFSIIQERSQNDLTNDIDASSEFSLDGSVNINILNFDPIQGVVELPANIVQTENTVAPVCSADAAIANANSFTIKGKGGVPPTPESPFSLYNISTDNLSAIPEPIETAKGKIQPARGIEVKADGTITLTAHRTDNSGARIPEPQINCSG